jgi:23S rRNA (cytidine1920-2'-O)/16S rRNA (cytidine1409-2'-O)-methyltransferase
LVILVKPQFEAGRVEASRARGVIRDPEIHRRTIGTVVDALAAAGAVIMGVMPSPLRGSAGNVEFLVYARSPHTTSDGPAASVADIDRLIDEAVAESVVVAAGGGEG